MSDEQRITSPAGLRERRPRAIAALSLTFGLVSIPVKIYSATESSAAIRFKLMGRGGLHVRQQYVADSPPDPDPGAWPVDAADAALPSGPSAPAGSDRSLDGATRSRSQSELAGAGGPLEGPSTPAPGAAHAASAANAASGSEAPPADAAPTSPLPFRRPGPALWEAPPWPAAPAPALDRERPHVVARSELLKGYEFEKGRYVLFTDAELEALRQSSRRTIDIVAFVPAQAVDPVYYDKAYLLAPDRGGERPYALLLAALQRSQRCAIAKWAWKSKEYAVEVRPASRALVLQQLFHADEVRPPDALAPAPVDLGETELELALRLIEQASVDDYDPAQFVDEEKQRILDAVQRKIAGRQMVTPEPVETAGGAQVIDLIAALRASLKPVAPRPSGDPPAKATRRADLQERKPARRAPSGTRATTAKAATRKA